MHFNNNMNATHIVWLINVWVHHPRCESLLVVHYYIAFEWSRKRNFSSHYQLVYIGSHGRSHGWRWTCVQEKIPINGSMPLPILHVCMGSVTCAHNPAVAYARLPSLCVQN